MSSETEIPSRLTGVESAPGQPHQVWGIDPPTKVSTPQPNNPGVRSGRGKGSPQRAQLVRRVLPLSGRALPTSPSPLQTPGHLPTGTMWCGVSPAWLWGL